MKTKQQIHDFINKIVADDDFNNLHVYKGVDQDENREFYFHIIGQYKNVYFDVYFYKYQGKETDIQFHNCEAVQEEISKLWSNTN